MWVQYIIVNPDEGEAPEIGAPDFSALGPESGVMGWADFMYWLESTNEDHTLVYWMEI